MLGNASQELRTLVDMLGYPCTNTLMGFGAYPASPPQFLAMLGMHRTIAATNAPQPCDGLLAVGAPFAHRVTVNPQPYPQNKPSTFLIALAPSNIPNR